MIFRGEHCQSPCLKPTLLIIGRARHEGQVVSTTQILSFFAQVPLQVPGQLSPLEHPVGGILPLEGDCVWPGHLDGTEAEIIPPI